MLTATIEEAQAHLLRLIDAAMRGEDVLIARDGEAAVKLVPLEADSKRREGGWAKSIVEIDPDWWKSNDDIIHVFENGDPNQLDRLETPL